MSAVAALKDCGVVLLLNKHDLDPAEELYRIYTAARLPHPPGQRRDGGGDGRAGRSALWQAICLYREFRRGEVQHPQPAGPPLRPEGGGGEPGPGPGTPHHPHVELFRLPNGAEIMDTPGFSSFEAEELNWELKQHLPETFLEFRPYLGQCRFVGCSHTKEKGCAVLEAVRHGEIQKSRHQSYLRLYEELKPLKEWEQKK